MAFALRAVKLTTLANLSIQAASIISGVLVARLLGPEGRGLYLAALLYPNILAGLASYGFVPMLAREAAQWKDEQHGRRIVGRAIVLALGQSILGVLGLWIVVYGLGLPPDEEARRLAFWYGAAWIPCNQLGIYLVAIDQGREAWGRHSFFRFITYPLYISGLLILWLSGHFSMPTVLIALWGSTVVSVILRIRFILRDYGRPVFADILYKQQCILALPYAGALYSTLVVTYLDGFLATVLLEKAAIGWYAVALTVAQLLNPFSKAFGLVAFTDSAKEQVRDEELARRRFAQRFRLIVMGFMVMGTGMALAMPFLIPLVYGEQFLLSVQIFFAMLPGGLAMSIGTILDERFRGKGMPQYGMKSMWVAASASAVIAVSFVGWLGPFALAIGFSIAQVARTGLLVFWFSRLEGMAITSLLLPRPEDLKQVPWRRFLRL